MEDTDGTCDIMLPSRHQQRSKILYSFSRRVSSTTVPSVARLRGGFNPWRMAGKSTCGHAHGH